MNNANNTKELDLRHEQNKEDAKIFILKYCKKSNKIPVEAINDLLVKIVVKENYHVDLTELDFSTNN